MADRILDRAFNRVYSSSYAKSSRAERENKKSLTETKTHADKRDEEGEEKVEEDKGAGRADPEKEVEHILSAWKDKDHFKVLKLPYPTVDALDRPIMACTLEEVTAAYRKTSRIVHPDKCSVKDANTAFTVLATVYKELKDASKLEEILKAAAVKAKTEAARQEAKATVAQRIQLNASKNMEAKSLRAQEGQGFQQQILQQMQKRKDDMARKKLAQSRRKQEEQNHDDGNGTPPDEAKIRKAKQDREESDEDVGVTLLRKRKKPTFI